MNFNYAMQYWKLFKKILACLDTSKAPGLDRIVSNVWKMVLKS